MEITRTRRARAILRPCALPLRDPVAEHAVLLSGLRQPLTRGQCSRDDTDEVVRIIEGPTKDTENNLDRVHVKALTDGLTGWVTVEGNQGTAFLVEGGGLFKVVQETILTPEFDVGAATKAVKDTTRKLKKDEIAEVREWPKEDSASGLTRMKLRVLGGGGEVGWATTVSNQGTVFIKLA